MSRRPNIERPIKLEISLPESLRGRLDLLLWSPTEGRIPQGAYSALIVQLLKDHLSLLESKDVLARSSGTDPSASR
jgi:hypothetical protein